ncbi:MAG: hypothetical protein L3J82_08565 [Planctomycetes bacterium]|nr:hypothetical protein [Planctomycetota bacterium]
MRYILMIAAFMLTATTPLFAQKGEVAPQPAPAEGEEKPADSDEGEEGAEEENVFKGLKGFLKDCKITQESIDSYLKHFKSFDKITEADEKFEELADENIVKALEHAFEQDWFKKWGKDNELDAKAWSKASILIMVCSIRSQFEKGLEESKAELKRVEDDKDMSEEEKAEAKAAAEFGIGIYTGMLESFSKDVPEVSKEETKLLTDNADAIAKTMEDDGEDDEEDMG